LLLFYYRYGPPGSAICVYSANKTGMDDNGIFTVFNKAYHNLRPEETSCTANNVPNDNPFTVSNINCVYAYSLKHLFVLLHRAGQYTGVISIWRYYICTGIYIEQKKYTGKPAYRRIPPYCKIPAHILTLSHHSVFTACTRQLLCWAFTYCISGNIGEQKIWRIGSRKCWRHFNLADGMAICIFI